LKFSQSYDDFATVDTALGPFNVSSTLSRADPGAAADACSFWLSGFAVSMLCQ
jgi:hypothetical protein